MNLTKDQESFYSFILNKMYKAASEDNMHLVLIMQIYIDDFNAGIDKLKETYDIRFRTCYPDYMESQVAEDNDIMEIHLTLPIEHTLAKKNY